MNLKAAFRSLAFWKPAPAGQLSMFEGDEPTSGYLRRDGVYVMAHRARRHRRKPIEAAAAPALDLLNLPPSLTAALVTEDPALLQRRSALDKLLEKRGGIHFLREQVAIQSPEQVQLLLNAMADVAGCTVEQIEAAIGLKDGTYDALPPRQPSAG